MARGTRVTEEERHARVARGLKAGMPPDRAAWSDNAHDPAIGTSPANAYKGIYRTRKNGIPFAGNWTWEAYLQAHHGIEQQEPPHDSPIWEFTPQQLLDHVKQIANSKPTPVGSLSNDQRKIAATAREQLETTGFINYDALVKQHGPAIQRIATSSDPRKAAQDLVKRLRARGLLPSHTTGSPWLLNPTVQQVDENHPDFVELKPTALRIAAQYAERNPNANAKAIETTAIDSLKRAIGQHQGPKGNPKQGLSTRVRNAVTNDITTHLRQQARNNTGAKKQANPESQTASIQLARRLLALHAAGKLTHEQVTTLLLQHEHGLNTIEISQRTNTPRATIGHQLKTARYTLKHAPQPD